MEEFRADPTIGANRGRHLLHIRAYRLAQIRNLIDESHFHGQEGIGGILGEFRQLRANEYNRRIAQRERLIKALHHFPASRILAADQHTIRMGKIANGRALAQELRIGADHDIQIRPKFTQPPLDIAARADGHRRFGCDDSRPVEMGCHLVHRLENIGEVSIAVAMAHRCPDRKEHKVGIPNRLRQAAGEKHAPTCDVALHELIKPRLIDGDLALIQLRDAVPVLVDASYHPAEIGKTSAGHEADIASTDHADLHYSPRFSRALAQ